jgi:tRNA A37 threonylcarbamoyladenosine dehydratase
MNDFETRFGGIARLYGNDGLRRLRAAHVAVVGIGGVGSWAVEALARSGVGALTLVDLDDVCASNVNRQIHALDGTIGQPKVAVMAERVRAINPECRVTAVQEFFTEANGRRLLDEMRPGCLIDAIDSVANKTLLIALGREKGIPLVCCGAAGGRREATAVRVADLSQVTHDRLLAEVRKRLRKEHGFPGDGKPMGIECVFSPEPPVFPSSDGSVCSQRMPAGSGDGTRLNCDQGLGSATIVTGTFGFAAAGQVVYRMAQSIEQRTSNAER